MWFGRRSLDEPDALSGATLAHSLQLADGKRLRKGHVLSSADIAALRAAGIGEVTVAVPEGGDLIEDAAAGLIADSIGPDGMRRDNVGTGRVNFHAMKDGVFVVEPDRVHALNAVDPAITLATLPNHSLVTAGQMVATVKIIPFAVAGSLVERAAAEVAGPATLGVRPFRDGYRVAVIQTRVAGTKDSVLDKTARVTADRLAEVHAAAVSETRVAHDQEILAAAIAERLPDADMVLVFGASAVTDRRDVVPRAIEISGGTIDHLGMPVDPGNLLVLGRIGSKPVIGAPGCARSPKENGFDWVLRRLCAGVEVKGGDIVEMGVGGLLAEIPIRPHPRERAKKSG